MLRVLKLFPAAVRQRSNNGGFIFTDILVCCLLLGVSAALLMAGVSSWQRQYYHRQLQQAAEVLTADVRQLQRQSMFDDRALNRQIRFMTDKGGYAFYADRKVVRKIYFRDFGCGKVSVDSKLAYVQYTSSGSPSLTGNIILRHENLPDVSCVLSVQPVTGRVVVSEK